MGKSKIYPHPHPDALEEARRLVSEVNSYTFEKKAVINACNNVDDARYWPAGQSFKYAAVCLNYAIERLRTRIEKIERVRDMLKELASKENA